MGTGWLGTKSGKTFLITNYHIFTGLRLVDGQPFDDHNLLPSKIRFEFEVFEGLNRSATASTSGKRVTGEFECDISNVVWNQILQSDVVALEISHLVPAKHTVHAWSLDSLDIPSDPLEVMQDLFVVGYPSTVLAKETNSPIYKSASVASEPELTESKGYFLADGKTKSGMSGSPVIWRKGFDAFKPDAALGGHILQNEIHQTYLVGVYSGRDVHDPKLYEAELGRVWNIKTTLTDLL